MISRKGRQVRKTYYQTTREPTVCAREQEWVSCPVCSETFDAALQDDPTTTVTCPRCHATLVPELFDESARLLVAVIHECREEERACQEGLDALDARKQKVPRLLRPLADRWYFAKRRAPLQDAAALAQSGLRCAKSKLKRTARQRYLVDRWHRETRCPVRWRFEGISQGFSPYYRDDGTWDINPLGPHGRGAAAEFMVYHRLLDACKRESSPLHGGRVFPCVRIPKTLVHPVSHKGASTTEIDCVLVTVKGAVVLEVKHAPYKIVAPSNHQVIYRMGHNKEGEPAPLDADEWGDGGEHQGWSPKLTSALDQNDYHGLCLNSLPIPLARRDILEQVVLVNVESFEGDSSFIDNVGVSYCTKAHSRFIEDLEEGLGDRPRVFQEAQLPKLEHVLRQLRDVSIRQSYRRCEAG